MKAVTEDPVKATLVGLGVVTILTRAMGTDYRGPLAVHAAKRRPDFGTLKRLVADQIDVWNAWYAAGLVSEDGDTDHLSLGAIVATCTLVDVVPIVDLCRYDIACVWRAPSGLIYCGDLPLGGTKRSLRIEDQRPYGDFSPGKFAWLLSDAKPTTERCPACFGKGSGRASAHIATCDGPNGTCFQTTCRCDCHASPRCVTCDGKGRCEPIQAKGKPGVWDWRYAP